MLVAPRGPVAPGDGLVFAGDREHGTEQGGRVYEVVNRGEDVELVFAHDAIDVSRIETGQLIWKTDDPQLTARLRKTFSGAKPQWRVGLDLEVSAKVGKPLRVVGRADNGATCVVESPDVLAAAIKHPLTDAVLREQLGRLGGTAYELRNLSADVTGAPMIPLSVLGKLRHAMVAAVGGVGAIEAAEANSLSCRGWPRRGAARRRKRRRDLGGVAGALSDAGAA